MELGEILPPVCKCDISEHDCAQIHIEYARDLYRAVIDVLAHTADRLTCTGDFDAVAEVAGLIPGAVEATKSLDRLVTEYAA